ncbi:MAG: 7-cyano-7-deazaguanine synthase QueC [Pseudanabaenales cyanobacterium]|nr:7-cyano-7-deazaguanine synthase QueC [Pseudanabaenales cyanobacterium]
MTVKKGDALVVLSGGQDSTICLFWAHEHFNTIHALSFDYGQRHKIELAAAKKIAKLLGVASHEIVELGPILQGRGPLVNNEEELEQYTDFESMTNIIGDRVELTFVPMRNALFLTLAANRAICKNIKHLVTGVCQEDTANYPDCRQSFIDAQQFTINQALGIDFFQIHTPLMNLNKAESIKLSLTLPGAYEALAWSHTAYDGQYPPIGKDHATVLRAWGFEQAGVPDPLIVRAWHEGKMDLPKTDNYSTKLVDQTLQQIQACSAQLSLNA